MPYGHSSTKIIQILDQKCKFGKQPEKPMQWDGTCHKLLLVK